MLVFLYCEPEAVWGGEMRQVGIVCWTYLTWTVKRISTWCAATFQGKKICPIVKTDENCILIKLKYKVMQTLEMWDVTIFYDHFVNMKQSVIVQVSWVRSCCFQSVVEWLYIQLQLLKFTAYHNVILDHHIHLRVPGAFRHGVLEIGTCESRARHKVDVLFGVEAHLF